MPLSVQDSLDAVVVDTAAVAACTIVNPGFTQSLIPCLNQTKAS